MSNKFLVLIRNEKDPLLRKAWGFQTMLFTIQLYLVFYFQPLTLLMPFHLSLTPGINICNY